MSVKETGLLKDSMHALLHSAVRMHWEYLPVWKEWEGIVGAEVASNAWPHHVAPDGILFIVVSDSIWMQQLSFQRHVLINELNLRLRAGKVREIRMFLGDVCALRRACSESWRIADRRRLELEYVTKELEGIADALVEPIGDEELRVLVKQLYLMSNVVKRN